MTTLIWKGITYQSLEYFNIKEDNGCYIVESRIIGFYKDQIYAVDYNLIIDKDWKIHEFVIKSEINRIKHQLTGKKLQEEWVINNVIHPDCKGFKYIDISLTPFTNTLPIHHLKLQENNPQEIDVIYIDVLNHHIKPAQQRYTRTAANKYLYENIQTYFKAEILVDENGLVVTYPDLFEKIGEL
ncbi:putative glycolipid-binding domain-containing protein [Chryseobacterium sp. SIMBA_028]|uniref:putative glycolipid-binding domain-containing protein n=2 Tax=Bacteria TaxID=2 RepID=UPI00397E6B2E